jgi:hypothetical protein
MKNLSKVLILVVIFAIGSPSNLKADPVQECFGDDYGISSNLLLALFGGIVGSMIETKDEDGNIKRHGAKGAIIAPAVFTAGRGLHCVTQSNQGQITRVNNARLTKPLPPSGPLSEASLKSALKASDRQTPAAAARITGTAK